MTPAVKAIIFTNIGAWVLTLFAPGLLIGWFGLTPEAVVTQGRVWQVATYLFIHEPGAIGHILFNMLFVWMFGVELERRWGTQAFTRYYFVVGVGAGVCVMVASFLPMPAAQLAYRIPTIGASGAAYGLLLAWAMVFPHRNILFMLVFPINARVFALLMGAIAFFYVAGGSSGPVSHVAHLGGLVIGWLYLKGPGNLRLDLKYHLARWRMERMRRKFDVHRGGRGGGGWNDRIH
jgi:membrane associated rhomboid family serine protease